MTTDVFITGSALACSLGNSSTQILTNLKYWDSENYENLVQEACLNNTLYHIHHSAQSPTKKYYQVLANVVNKAIKKAGLTYKMQEELTIFIGSTSMKIASDEEQLTHLGNGIIGQFVADITHSKNHFYLISTACTSSANAFDYAAKMIKNQQIKRALVIGIEILNKSTKMGFESLLLLSEKNIYRPFDETSDGIVLGEACSALILDTQRNSSDDFAYLGSANVCDNYSETTSNPDGISIAECLNKALQDANLSIEQIDLIKAHATGSLNNNLAEAKGLDLFMQNHPIPICALKPFIGHTLGACGTNEITLLLLCIKNGFVPSVRGFNHHNELTFTPLQNKIKTHGKANILFNYIGFSGNNTAIILGKK